MRTQRQFAEELLVAVESMLEKHAIGWLIVATSTAGPATYFGLYPDPASAMKAAERLEAETNRETEKLTGQKNTHTMTVVPLQIGPDAPPIVLAP